MQRLKGKVAIVTASTDGIGYAIAERLASEGAKVVVSSRRQTNVDRALEQLSRQGYDVAGCVCHVANQQHRQQIIQLALEKFGGIDILVSNAGINPVYGSFLDTSETVWDKIFEVNLKSMFFLVKEIVPHMEKRGGGSIVLVSSSGGYKTSPLLGAYSISKTALLSLTKVLAQQLGAMNMRVNCIAPGLIKTRMSEMVWNNEMAVETALANAAIKRVGEPHECAGAVAFLVSDDASYITGETIIMNGGEHCRL